MYFLSQDQKAVGSGLVWLCRAQDIDEFESYYILLCSKLIQRSTLLFTWFIIVLVKQHMHTFRKKVLNVSPVPVQKVLKKSFVHCKY